jgi:uncharacterized protein
VSLVLLDAAVFIYAVGGEHRLREPCRAVLNQGANGRVVLSASVEAIQEFVHHRLRRTNDRARAANEGIAAAGLCTVLDFTGEILQRSLSLIRDHPTIRGRDAVHAATALLHGIDTIVSPDEAFDGIPGLARVSPEDFATL